MKEKYASAKLTEYRRTAQARSKQERSELFKRRRRAWAVARKAAQYLKNKYGAQRVVVFGSLLSGERFTRWSDVDLAAWGVRPVDYFEAVARVLDLGNGLELNLVDAERCKSSLREQIEREGKEV
jgi:predicted nucleotidyltransferase